MTTAPAAASYVAHRPQLAALVRIRRSPTTRRATAVASSLFMVTLAVLAARHFATTGWPLTTGHPAVLGAAGLLLLAAQALKALGWARLFPREERPSVAALAAGNGGAALCTVVMPGRFDEAMRVAVVRRCPRCPASIRALALSLVMLGLIDSVALAPLALAAVIFPSAGGAVTAGLAVVAAGGVGAAAAIVVLPRAASTRYAARFRIGRWLRPRTSSLRSATEAWTLVSACWLLRALAVFLVLGTVGLGFSLPLALLFLCAGAAAVAVPFSPAGGTATQVGAGATALVAAGTGTTPAIGAAVSIAALGVFSGAAVLLLAIACNGVAAVARSRRSIRVCS